jgi:hypothetical protein
MGYTRYTVYRNGQEIEAGYGVDDVCNKDGCTAEIDRGLGFLCGRSPGGDEHGCGFYFCGEHLLGQQCESCHATAEKQKREEFCDVLASQVKAMDGVKSADVLADKPELLVDFDNGDQFVISVT